MIPVSSFWKTSRPSVIAQGAGRATTHACRRYAVVSIIGLLVTALSVADAGEGPQGGHLLIIGGGRRGPELMKEYVRLAGGPGRASILVLPMASGDGDTTGRKWQRNSAAWAYRQRVHSSLRAHRP